MPRLGHGLVSASCVRAVLGLTAVVMLVGTGAGRPHFSYKAGTLGKLVALNIQHVSTVYSSHSAVARIGRRNDKLILYLHDSYISE